MKPLIVLMVIVLIGCLGCEVKTALTNPSPHAHRIDQYPPQPPNILGWRNWIETEGMLGRITPANVGYSVAYRFDRDSTVYLFIDETFAQKWKFRIVRAPALTFDTSNILVEGEPPTKGGQIVEFMGSDILKLTSLDLDGGISTYTRLPHRRF